MCVYVYVFILKKIFLKTCKNIIAKLTGTSWKCSTSVLRTSALALVYGVAKNCSPE